MMSTTRSRVPTMVRPLHLDAVDPPPT